ncbi:hypothetical protein [Flavobacterium sp. HSC-61S13]|uniref:hypothetical protein n=1 Tax=Flavobacterium sp. HSC-61S13 TaxID=2910963 RepID=UPI00209CDDAA|nr:hypothetical protein [Flavobacterium sp. HSC-61S13]MCP1994385.1 hypothetical protein [Flavobacterium sp. HSC-61S13]
MSVDIEKYKQDALKILSPIKPADNETKAEKDFLFSAIRSDAGREIQDYYLVYFLFVKLLGFKNLGQFEKIAWSVPIDYNGKAFLIEHRKFGVGIFIQNKDDEEEAKIITKKINGAIKSSRPYFNYLANEAVKSSKINIVNNNEDLFNRYNYFLKLYKSEFEEKENKNKEQITFENKFVFGSSDYIHLRNSTKWLAISVIEAFFSWTEHLFIHLSVITQKIKTGGEVSRLIDAEWKDKFRMAISDHTLEKYFNDLLLIRNQVRNFVAHGAFGKDGNAFYFHSGAGAVPVIMDFNRNKNRFSFSGKLSFNDEEVINLIELFINDLFTSNLKPALIYTQENNLITILPHASNGFYESAMQDVETMEKFCHYLHNMFDNAANMDF